MPPAFRFSVASATAITALAVATLWSAAFSQTVLPNVTVEAKKSAKAPAAKATTEPTPDTAESTQAANRSLTVPTSSEASANLAKVPGSVVVVPDTAYKDTTPAATLKDVLDYVPGIFVQSKWGEDSRLSIRGSGLSRNFHLRGVNLYMDGIPINTADGFGDFQEIDPTAYRYVEVYKGANGLRFGASSLGGAINFVTPTGRDASPFSASADIGSFGFHRLQSSAGGANGPFDFFITGSWQEQDGFRDHSWGDSTRVSANLGYQLSTNIETRFYLNANDINQRIPGSVDKAIALASPKTAFTDNVVNDWQRNIDSLRLANKTTVQLAPGTVLEFGGFVVDRHLMHPIFQWLDYQYDDYGGFGRLTSEQNIGGFRNRLLLGINLHNGSVDADQYDNIGGHKGALLSSSVNTSKNLALYAENAFYVLPNVAVVAGTQYLAARRDLDDRFLADGDQSGQSTFNVWSPKAGLLWEIARTWQAYANVSRSAEVPSFGENSFAAVSSFDAKLQTATTYEIGTRGHTADYTWDLAVYRADIDHELQCTAPFPVANFCVIQNANKTIHQGVEVAFGATVAKSMLAQGPSPDRVWLNLAYTFSDFRFDDDPLYGNNELPGAPRHYLRAELLYKHPNGVYVGPNVEWVPRAYFVDSANTLDTEPYTLWGLKAGYDPKGGPFSVYLEGRNLADKHYIASTGITNVADPIASQLFEPGTGRAVYAGVKYKW